MLNSDWLIAVIFFLQIQALHCEYICIEYHLFIIYRKFRFNSHKNIHNGLMLNFLFILLAKCITL